MIHNCYPFIHIQRSLMFLSPHVCCNGYHRQTIIIRPFVRQYSVRVHVEKDTVHKPVELPFPSSLFVWRRWQQLRTPVSTGFTPCYGSGIPNALESVVFPNNKCEGCVLLITVWKHKKRRLIINNKNRCFLKKIDPHNLRTNIFTLRHYLLRTKLCVPTQINVYLNALLT